MAAEVIEKSTPPETERTLADIRDELGALRAELPEMIAQALREVGLVQRESAKAPTPLPPQ
jgi:hypothetical protein